MPSDASVHSSDAGVDAYDASAIGADAGSADSSSDTNTDDGSAGRCGGRASSRPTPATTPLTFATPVAIAGAPSQSIIHGLAVLDANGDGVPDLVTSAGPSGQPPWSGSVVFLPGTGSRTFGPGVTAWSGEPISGVVAMDVDGDQKMDLVVAEDERHVAANQWLALILQGDGTGAFTSGPSYAEPAPVLNPPLSGDFNGDGVPDLLLYKSQEIDVRLNMGGAFPAEIALPLGTQSWDPYALAVGHFNADDNLDVAFIMLGDSMSSLGGSAGVLDGAGDGTLSAGPVSANASGQNTAMAVADFDGDGLDEVAFTTMDGSKYSLQVLSPSCPDGASLAPVFQASLPNLAQNMATGDFDGDGWPDIAVVSGADLYVFQGRSGNTFGTPVVVPSVGANPATIAVADLDGDHRSDIVLAYPFGSHGGPPNVVIVFGGSGP